MIEYPLGICPRIIPLGLEVDWFLIFWKNHHTDFQNVCTSLYSHQQWRSVPLTPHPLQHKVSSVFLIGVTILTGVSWNLRVVSICIPLMIKDVGQFFKCLSVTWVSSVENSLFSSLPHFKIGLFGILLSSFLSSLYILEISPLLDVGNFERHHHPWSQALL